MGEMKATQLPHGVNVKVTSYVLSLCLVHSKYSRNTIIIITIILMVPPRGTRKIYLAPKY